MMQSNESPCSFITSMRSNTGWRASQCQCRVKCKGSLMAWNLDFLRPQTDSVKARIERHMGGNCRQSQIISHSIQPLEQVNLQIILDKWLHTSSGDDLFGCSFQHYSMEK